MYFKNWYLINKIDIQRTIMLFIICLSVVFLFGMSALSEDNYNYAIEEMHAYNSNLFRNNINTVGSDYSPRLYANKFMAGMMKLLNAEWSTAAMILVRINYVLYAAALTVFAKRIFRNNQILGVLLLAICCMSGSLISLAFDLNGAEDVFLGTAIPLALIALALVTGEKRNWNMAWIFLALAEFMHVHEGIWAGCVLGVIWITDCIMAKKIQWEYIKSILVYIISVILVVMPGLMNTKAVNDALFNEIYVFIRTPHHLLLSNWGVEKILASGIMLIGAFYVLFMDYKKNTTESKKKNLSGYIALLVLWVILLLVEYLSTEIFTNSTVVTMYVPKCFKYITWAAVLIYAKYGIGYLEKRKYIQGLSLIGIILVPIPHSRSNIFTYIAYAIYGVLLIVFFFFEKYELDKKLFASKENSEILIMLSQVIIFPVVLCRIFLSCGLSKAVFALPVLTILLFICYMQRRAGMIRRVNILVCVGLIISVISSSAGFIYNINRSGVRYVTGDDYVRDSVGQDVFELAKKFEDLTDLDTVFLADPDSMQSNGFQLASHRSCYALIKNTPSSKHAVIDWYERIESTRKMTYCSAEELQELMKTIDIHYVLVTEDRFNELENSGLFNVTVKNEKFTVFCLEK